MIDMHIHTIFSNGEMFPLEVLDKCKKNNVNIMSITDHNSIVGVRAAMEKNPYKDIRVISGIELAAVSERGIHKHFLGYNFDVNNTHLNKMLNYIRMDGFDMLLSMVQILIKEYGIIFSNKEITEIFGTPGDIGRSQLAKFLVLNNYAHTEKEAYDKYLQPIRDRGVKREISLTDRDCINFIKNAGGVVCLAHPYQLRMDYSELERYLKYLKCCGLDAIEVYHSEQSIPMRIKLEKLADKLELKKSVGSDYHGKMSTPNIRIGYGIKNNLMKESASILDLIK